MFIIVAAAVAVELLGLLFTLSLAKCAAMPLPPWPNYKRK